MPRHLMDLFGLDMVGKKVGNPAAVGDKIDPAVLSPHGPGIISLVIGDLFECLSPDIVEPKIMIQGPSYRFHHQ